MDGEADGDWERRRREKIAAAKSKRRRRAMLIVAGLMAAALVAAGILAYESMDRGKPAVRAPVNNVTDYNETMVSVKLSSVNDAAVFFKWQGKEKTIRFFAVMGTDGQVRTAFDNAYCCYHNDLGERQEGGKIVCNWCNKAYPIDDLNRNNLIATMVSQCCPANLPHTVAGNLVLIEKSDLEAGAYLFKK